MMPESDATAPPYRPTVVVKLDLAPPTASAAAPSALSLPSARSALSAMTAMKAMKARKASTVLLAHRRAAAGVHDVSGVPGAPRHWQAAVYPPRWAAKATFR